LRFIILLAPFSKLVRLGLLVGSWFSAVNYRSQAVVSEYQLHDLGPLYVVFAVIVE
jgi:hypothetical protein